LRHLQEDEGWGMRAGYILHDVSGGYRRFFGRYFMVFLKGFEELE
jgi:hypothetical protein